MSYIEMQIIIHHCFTNQFVKMTSICFNRFYGINYKIEYSFYERSQPKDKKISLIQTAAVYGSLKIF